MERLCENAVFPEPFGNHMGQFRFAGSRFAGDPDHEFIFFPLQDPLYYGFPGIAVFVFYQ
jgi:hypothetical protein